MIWHLIPLSRWRSEPDPGYVPGTRDAARSCTPRQTSRPRWPVANALYAQAGEPLVALALTESALSAPVRYEPGPWGRCQGGVRNVVPHVSAGGEGGGDRGQVPAAGPGRPVHGAGSTARDRRGARPAAAPRRRCTATPGPPSPGPSPSRPATRAGAPRPPPSTPAAVRRAVALARGPLGRAVAVARGGPLALRLGGTGSSPAAIPRLSRWAQTCGRAAAAAAGAGRPLAAATPVGRRRFS